MTRIRTTAQARRLRQMAKVIAARKRFWRIADRLLIESPYATDSEEHLALLGEYYETLGDKLRAEMCYIDQGGQINKLRGARFLD